MLNSKHRSYIWMLISSEAAPWGRTGRWFHTTRRGQDKKNNSRREIPPWNKANSDLLRRANVNKRTSSFAKRSQIFTQVSFIPRNVNLTRELCGGSSLRSGRLSLRLASRRRFGIRAQFQMFAMDSRPTVRRLSSVWAQKKKKEKK